MTDPIAVLDRNLTRSISAMQRLMGDADRRAAFARAASLVVERYRSAGRLYVAGNGGSAADAQHIAAELVCRFARDRAPLPAEALTVDPSVMTAIGNDYGFDKVFSRQLAAKATPRDVFLGITTSGRSPNILAALEQCRALGIPSILFSGGDGGLAAKTADVVVLAFGDETSTIQESHILLGHSLCECVESALS